MMDDHCPPIKENFVWSDSRQKKVKVFIFRYSSYRRDGQVVRSQALPVELAVHSQISQLHTGHAGRQRPLTRYAGCFQTELMILVAICNKYINLCINMYYVS